MKLEKTFFQKILLEWYKKEGRHTLPWRHTTDLYKITAAEVMLQQTNVPKVIERYTAFLKQFPAWQKLADASAAQVIQAWQGLGYNRRALYLHKMAQIVTKEYNGILPEDPQKLAQLPGMGPYTRHAVLVFGRNKNLSATDVNISRIVRRWHGLSTWDQTPAQAEIAQFVPKGKSRDWHNAMMDFASMICTKKKPKCMTCPLAEVCKSYPLPQDEKKVHRKEPGRTENGKHIPRRIFRGRTVEILRSGPAKLTTIGLQIKKDWHAEKDHEWLREILSQLKKEGMVDETKQEWHLKN